MRLKLLQERAHLLAHRMIGAEVLPKNALGPLRRRADCAISECGLDPSELSQDLSYFLVVRAEFMFRDDEGALDQRLRRRCHPQCQQVARKVREGHTERWMV